MVTSSSCISYLTGASFGVVELEMAQPDENEYVEKATKENYIYIARKCLSPELVCSHWRYVNWFQMSEETINFM